MEKIREYLQARVRDDDGVGRWRHVRFLVAGVWTDWFEFSTDTFAVTDDAVVVNIGTNTDWDVYPLAAIAGYQERWS